jgi:hypothetical protein
VRLAGKPMEQGAPDRWWVLGAANGRLIVYALCSAVPFAPETGRSGPLSPVAGTVAELQTSIRNLEGLMERLAPEFFDGGPGDPAARRQLRQALASVLPVELLPQYRALAPDFWIWLEAP